MRSIRTERRRAKTKSQIMTMGGSGEYYINKTEIGELAQIIASAPNKRLVEFLDALLTKKELVDITRRIIVAKMLMANKTYEEIIKQTHTSNSTIRLVKQSLDEYEGLLGDLLSQHIHISSHSQKINPGKMTNPAENYFRNRIRKGK